MSTSKNSNKQKHKETIKKPAVKREDLLISEAGPSESGIQASAKQEDRLAGQAGPVESVSKASTKQEDQLISEAGPVESEIQTSAKQEERLAGQAGPVEDESKASAKRPSGKDSSKGTEPLDKDNKHVGKDTKHLDKYSKPIDKSRQSSDKEGSKDANLGGFRRALLVNAPGMRIIKTSLAVALCIFIEYFRNTGGPSATAIVALFCLQHDLKSTLESSINRVVGTIVAGVFGYGFLLLAFQAFGLSKNSLAYTLLFLLGLIIIMQTLVLIKMPGGAGIAAMTFIIIGFSYRTNQEVSSLLYTIETVIDSLIGIFAALFVDWLPPLNKLGKKLYLAKAPYMSEDYKDSDFELEDFEHNSQLRNLFKKKK